MLPKIHLGTLITVTDSHLANQSRQQKQIIMEARANRNTEGFYVYQTYLKRLRRMHRAYVTKIKQQNLNIPSQKPGSQAQEMFDVRGNYINTNQLYRKLVNEDQTHLPWLKHRISLSVPLPSPRSSNDSESPLQSSSFTPQMLGDAEDITTSSAKTNENGVSRSSFSIRIPCGKEETFDLSNSLRTDTRLSKTNGALPFRMWKKHRDQSGNTSVYTQNSVSEQLDSKPRHTSKRVVPRTVIEPSLLINNSKK